MTTSKNKGGQAMLKVTIHNEETDEETTITTDKVRVMWHNTTHIDPDDPEWWADEWEAKRKGVR